ncbi:MULTISPECIES: glycosyltransferase family 2 protein [Brevibacillus]|uniref:glycosyltransferase family 2 protein n=1 Tax=Brevibacillus TaxID=55080 RepID=UPI001E50E058|nr:MULTISPECIES: glycosyltransferase family 2 protein [Bacillales]MDT3417896.1 glycosyltransferase involved in cell wall biosynthesis [Brevibacillus aydinogluensis]
MTTVSLVMIVKNEANKLARCLNSAKDLVNEIVIVDTGSTDGTKEIAKKFGAKVYDFVWNDSFSEARNFALDKSQGEWNLILDADEYITGECKVHLQKFINNYMAIGRISIVSKYEENNEVRYTRHFASRLLPRGSYYRGRIHEQVVSDLPHIRTGIEVYHDGYYLTDKTDRNLPLLLKELEEHPDDPYILYHIAINYKNKKDYETADKYFARAYARFTREEGFAPVLVVDYLYNIMANGNLEDGIEIIRNEKEFLRDYPDYHFVTGLFYMDYIQKDIAGRLEMIDWIEHSFLTCLQLGDTKRSDSVLGVGSFLAAYNLGVVYEVFGLNEKAASYYAEAAALGYAPAAHRLELLSKSTS